MKTVLGLLACSFVLAACADQTPARDPSSATNTTATQTEAYGSSAPAATASSLDAPARNSTPTQPAPVNERHAARPEGAAGDDTFAERGAPATAGSLDTSKKTEAGKADSGKNVDNTKNNERDRHGTLTPGNQGNSSSETKITADIRKGLMSSNNLSFTAKNAKVITVGSKVTLRGVVKTDAEKTEIESVARGTAGVSDVDNQLEVKK